MTNLSTTHNALDYQKEVQVIGVNDLAPGGELLGTVKVGDTGFTTKCSYEIVIGKAKEEARKVGGNLLKITKHQAPNFGSSCHRIEAAVYKVPEGLFTNLVPDEPQFFDPDADYAILHIYRISSVGPLVSYNLYLGDSLLCRVSNRFKESLEIRKRGLNKLWARTESRAEVPIDVEFGREYYLRCSVDMGLMVGRPDIVLVDPKVGKFEYESVKEKKR